MGSSLTRSSSTTTWAVQTFVSVGPYQLWRVAAGNSSRSFRRYGVGNTSPANTTWRSDPRLDASTPPCVTHWISALGTEYQTVMPRSFTNAAVEAPNRIASTGMGCRVAPANAV